jgi:hypothetical protein
MTLSVFDLLLVAVLGLGGWYWFSSTRVREIAVDAARRATKAADVQLLDQTVALARVSMSRDGSGQWRLWRQYRFEFSRDGIERETGHIIMLGRRLEAVVVTEAPTLH